jgi:hypothetical protein
LVDRIETIAKLVDEVSGPLTKIQREMRGFNEDMKRRGPHLSIQAIANATKAAEKRFELFGKAGSLLKRELRGVQDALHRVAPEYSPVTAATAALATGTGSLITAVVALAGAVAAGTLALARFGKSARETRYLSEATNLGVRRIKELELAGEHFGISAEEMDDSLKGLSARSEDFIKNVDEMQGSLARQGFSMQKLAPIFEEMRGKTGDAGAALVGLLRVFKNLKDQGATTHVLEVLAQAFHASAKFARLNNDELAQQLGLIEQIYDPQLADRVQHQAETFNQEIEKTNIVFAQWGNIIRNQVFGPFQDLVREFNTWASDPQSIDFLKTLTGYAGQLVEGLADAVRWMEKLTAHPQALEQAKAGAIMGGGVGILGGPTGAAAGAAAGFWLGFESGLAQEREQTRRAGRALQWRRRLTEGAGPRGEVPHFQEGGVVPRDMLARVHQGEIIIPPDVEGAGPGFGDLGEDILQAGGTAEMQEQMRRIWEKYWKVFDTQGRRFANLGTAGGGGGGGGGGYSGDGATGAAPSSGGPGAPSSSSAAPSTSGPGGPGAPATTDGAPQAPAGTTGAPAAPGAPGAPQTPAAAAPSAAPSAGDIGLSGGAAERGAASSLTRMNPELRARFAALSELAKKEGHSVSLMSGFRDPDDPRIQAIYREHLRHPSGLPMAEPHRSMHGRGLAGDIDGDTAWAYRNMHRVGLYQPMPQRDPRHIQMDPRYHGQSFYHRDAVNQAMKHEVTGTARVDVNVSAPKPATQGRGGIFKRVQAHRNPQMPQSSTGANEIPM